MNEPVREFLSARMNLPGLVAWGALISPGEFASQSQNHWLNSTRLERTHQELTAAAQRLANEHQLAGSRMCWVFEHVRIYFAARPDGTSLACYTQNAPGAPLAEIQNVLEDFVK